MAPNGAACVLKHIVHRHRIILFRYLYGYVSIDNVLMEMSSIVMNDEPGRMWEEST
jgi:hypothetical protein